MNYKTILKSASLVLLVLGASQSAVAMEKDWSNMYEAIEAGDLPAVKKFLNYCGDINKKTGWGPPLVVAACRGQLAIVKELISRGADLHSVDYNNDCALYRACEKGHLDIVKELIKSGANIHFQNSWGRTSLHVACREGHLDIVKELIKSGAHVNCAKDSGSTPLHDASSENHYYSAAIIGELIKNGADINALDFRGCTPLHQASNAAIVQELIDNGANINLLDKEGTTPLYSVAMHNELEACKQLIKNGANTKIEIVVDDEKRLWQTAQTRINQCIAELAELAKKQKEEEEKPYTIVEAAKHNNKEGVEWFLKQGVSPDATDPSDEYGCRPLGWAAVNGNSAIASLLLERGAHVDCPNKLGDTPLGLAAESLKLEVVRLLTAKGAKYKEISNKYGTPLTRACRNGYLEIAEELIKSSANINTKDDENKTILHRLFDNPFYELDNTLKLIKILIKNGADINSQDEKGHTPLHLACYHCEPEIAEELIAADADIDLVCSGGFGCENKPLTSLEICLSRHFLGSGISMHKKRTFQEENTYNRLRIAKKLISRGVDINVTNHYGETCLCVATCYGDIETVKELIKNGACIHSRTNEGETAFDVAIKKKHIHIAELIADALEKEADFKKQSVLGIFNTVIKHPLKFNKADEKLSQVQALIQSQPSIANKDLSLLLNNSFLWQRDKCAKKEDPELFAEIKDQPELYLIGRTPIYLLPSQQKSQSNCLIS